LYYRLENKISHNISPLIVDQYPKELHIIKQKVSKRLINVAVITCEIGLSAVFVIKRKYWLNRNVGTNIYIYMTNKNEYKILWTMQKGTCANSIENVVEIWCLLTRLERMYFSNTTLLDSRDMYRIYYIRYCFGSLRQLVVLDKKLQNLTHPHAPTLQPSLPRHHQLIFQHTDKRD